MAEPGIVLKITDAGSLESASDLLHDAFFSREDIAYEEDQRLFRLGVWREVTELSRRRRVIPFLYRIEMPRTRCLLEVRSVTSASIEVTDGIGIDRYCLTEIRYDPRHGRLWFAVEGPLKVELALDELCAELQDQGEASWEWPRTLTLALSWRP